MTYLLGHIYKDYLELNKTFVEDAVFKSICAEFNIAIIDYILEGKTFNMGNYLSSLSVRQINRNNSKPTIDWGESNIYKKEILDKGDKLFNKETGEGTKWHIYYTDLKYYRYFWNKGRCNVPNKSVYKFTPTRGLKGNKEKLTNLLKEDELAYLKFKKN